jgi:hypothetical protein
VNDELDGVHRVAVGVPQEVERVDALGDRVIEDGDLLRRPLPEDGRVERVGGRADLHPLLVLPAGLADPQPVDQPVLADHLED